MYSSAAFYLCVTGVVNRRLVAVTDRNSAAVLDSGIRMIGDRLPVGRVRVYRKNDAKTSGRVEAGGGRWEAGREEVIFFVVLCLNTALRKRPFSVVAPRRDAMSET